MSAIAAAVRRKWRGLPLGETRRSKPSNDHGIHAYAAVCGWKIQSRKYVPVAKAMAANSDPARLMPSARAKKHVPASAVATFATIASVVPCVAVRIVNHVKGDSTPVCWLANCGHPPNTMSFHSGR